MFTYLLVYLQSLLIIYLHLLQLSYTIILYTIIIHLLDDRSSGQK